MTDNHSDARALAIIPRNVAELMQLSEMLAKSELLPKALRGKIPDVAMTIAAGQEMGMTPMSALRNFHVIDGKPVLGADGMVGLVLGSGKAVYFDRVEESDTSVTYETLRVGSKVPRRCTWTIEQAKRAALHLKDNWRGYPRHMLAARAKSELARDVYPDVLAGCATYDEADMYDPDLPRPQRAPSKNADAVDAEIVSDTPPEPPEFGAIAATTSVDELRSLAKSFNKKLPEDVKARIRAAYDARLAELTQPTAQAEVAS